MAITNTLTKNAPVYNAEQLARIASQKAQLAGTKTAAQAQAERDLATKTALDTSKTINNFIPQDQANIDAQKAINLKYALSGGTGLTPNSRSQVLPSSAPTPVNPMKEVSASGANTKPVMAPVISSPGAPASQYIAPPAPTKPVTTMTGGQMSAIQNQQKTPADMLASGDVQGYLMAGGDYSVLKPEQIIQAQSQAAQAQGRRMADINNQVADTQENQLAARQRQVEEELAAKKAEEEAANAEAVAKFQAEQEAQKQAAIGQINTSAQQRTEQADMSMAFSGFGRSTKAAEIRDSIRQDTQAQIADIERQSGRAIDEYRASLLDQTNAKLEKIQARVDAFDSEKDKVELEKVKAQGQLMVDLFKQDPLNPTNMMDTAQKLSAMRIDKRKMDLEEQKAVRDDAQKNFQFMINSFGSGYIQNMNNEELVNLASNLGMSPQTLANIPQTVDEIKQEWERAKYSADREFEINKMTWQNEQDLKKMGIGFDYDMQKMYLGEQFKSAAEQAKYANLGYGTFAGQANQADGSSLYFDAPTTVNGKSVIASNPKLVNAYPAGYKKFAGKNGMAGQCAYEAEQMVTCPVLGNTLQQKLNTLKGLVNSGKAFYKGQGQPQVGNTIISNDSKTYGHVSVINSIKPDGTLVLSEFNRAAPLTFSNTREIKPNDPSIYGFIASKPKAGYEVAKGVQQLAKDASNSSGMAKGLSAIAGQTAIGSAANQMGSALLKYFGADQTLINQAQQGEQAYQAGVEDEAGATMTPDRQAVRAGVELPAETVKNLAQYNPQAYQQYMSDLVYGKSNTAKQKSMEAYNKPLDMNASKALGYAASAQQAEGEIGRIPSQAAIGELNNWLTRSSNENAVVNDTINQMKSPEARAIAQAELQWVANVLRQESGAAISATEYFNAGNTYFPRPGDDQAALARKAAARQQKIEGLLLQAGPQGLQYFQSRGYQVPSGLTNFYGNQGMDMSAYQQQPQQQQYDPLGLGISQGGNNDPLGLGL